MECEGTSEYFWHQTHQTDETDRRHLTGEMLSAVTEYYGASGEWSPLQSRPTDELGWLLYFQTRLFDLIHSFYR